MAATVRSRPRTVLVLAVALAGTAACGGDSPTSPDLDLSQSVPLEGNSTLVYQGGSAAAFGEHRGKVEQITKDAYAAARQRIPLDGITIVLRPGSDDAIPEIGIGGRANAGTVTMTFDTNGSRWIASLDTHLVALMAHEMHHVARFRALGLYANLLDAMVGEGLADQFSIEIARIPPPIWSTALTPEQLQTWSARARPEWFSPNYDHGAWFLGTGEIPRWAGYTIGFEITGDYMAASGRSAASLYNEPHASFADDG